MAISDSNIIFSYLSESLMSIVEMFRIALDNVGNSEVRFITGGVLQRRKSKNPMLDVPKVLISNYQTNLY